MRKQPQCSSIRGLSRLAILTIRMQSHAKLLSAYRQGVENSGRVL